MYDFVFTIEDSIQHPTYKLVITLHYVVSENQLNNWLKRKKRAFTNWPVAKTNTDPHITSSYTQNNSQFKNIYPDLNNPTVVEGPLSRNGTKPIQTPFLMKGLLIQDELVTNENWQKFHASLNVHFQEFMLREKWNFIIMLIFKI